MGKYIIALTGASGVIYGIELARQLLERGIQIHLIASEPACIVLEQELGWCFLKTAGETFKSYLPYNNLIVYDNNDIAARIASGSFLTDGMIVIPCTMASVAAIAHGNARSLIERAADVMLKEKRPLIIVPRETPLNAIHLRNMLILAEMGVSIIPAMPAFYNRPRSVDEMVAFMVGKILDAIHIEHDLFTRYDN
ncbi:MAG TPA: flavin prenyltransferase UbiX [Syntrophomonadaceae bacterium]|nr:UbiX family flavin prenyltransferase [Syntrophomonadaceae bacterium]HNX27825.1 flavin prenyltransferase UbiX [Syntrophomonadaceae bacterium]HPR93617.1 flavin prenyltransferase UbiX [Syntrophomonadaceae bacterium]